MRFARDGFTLIEVLVAIVLIDAGLLALVAGSALLVRNAAEVRIRTDAMRAATTRVQTLGASSCGAASGTSGQTADATASLRESWRVVLQPNGVREVHDSVAYAAAGVPKSFSIVTRVAC